MCFCLEIETKPIKACQLIRSVYRACAVIHVTISGKWNWSQRNIFIFLLFVQIFREFSTEWSIVIIFCGLSDWLVQVEICKNFPKLLFCTLKWVVYPILSYPRVYREVRSIAGTFRYKLLARGLGPVWNDQQGSMKNGNRGPWSVCLVMSIRCLSCSLYLFADGQSQRNPFNCQWICFTRYWYAKILRRDGTGIIQVRFCKIIHPNQPPLVLHLRILRIHNINFNHSCEKK